MTHPRRIKFSGEVEPAQEPQTLSATIPLIQLLRVQEQTEQAKLKGDSELRTISGVVDAALTLYFASLPEKEREHIDKLANMSLGLMVEDEAYRASYNATKDPAVTPTAT